ncbi:flavin-containing monooxygenase [Nocardia wallacei]|uniref:flavin-containing monooxygenase n=1 Tax=Nocardia wallacei TaxID=480035 RepID=UPI00245767F5|nr:NAD(P)/FAD-dependent oxidoreductase [Nocardia wallacei]
MKSDVEQSGTEETVRRVGTVIIGAGFAGLGAAMELDRAAHRDFLIIERGPEVGGTWRDNSYPGAACDVPSHLYSLSFAPNPDWSRTFSSQPEIQDYLRRIARRSGVLDRAWFDTQLTRARWDEAAALWRVDTTRGPVAAEYLVCGFGVLCEPRLPDIPGIETFEGDLFHSSRWNHEVELRGKRVAVIGTGASAIQIVPAIAATVGHLEVYQRTAPWLLPRLDRPYTAVERWAFRHLPGWRKLNRASVYLMRETQGYCLTRGPAFTKPLELIAEAKLRWEIRDPELRARVRPTFRIGCKRMLPSNDYYPALCRENVDLITTPIREITPDAVVTADGARHAADILVVATGFHVTDSPTFAIVHGRDGRSMAEMFDGAGPRAYKGTTMTNFPNAFVLTGPNTATGHTSQLYMIEAQLAYLVDALTTLRERGLRTFEVRADAQADYNARIQAELTGSVWNSGGCRSWYLDKNGHNTTLWPGTTWPFRRETRRFDLEAYEVTAAPAQERETSAAS